MTWFIKLFAFVFGPRTGAGGVVLPQNPAARDPIKSKTILSQCVSSPEFAGEKKLVGRLAATCGATPVCPASLPRHGDGQSSVVPVTRRPVKRRRAGRLAFLVSSMTSSQIGKLLGNNPEVRAALHQVEHQDCDYGIHWKWNGRDALYNPWGIIRIVRGLCRRGFRHQAALVGRAAGLPDYSRPQKKFWWDDL